MIIMTVLTVACSSSDAAEDSNASLEEAPAVQPAETETVQPTDQPTLPVPESTETNTPQPLVEAPPMTPEEQEQSKEPAAPTAQPAATEDPAALVTSGQTDEGVFFLGNPNAAVTVIDYSDFL